MKIKLMDLVFSCMYFLILKAVNTKKKVKIMQKQIQKLQLKKLSEKIVFLRINEWNPLTNFANTKICILLHKAAVKCL